MLDRAIADVQFAFSSGDAKAFWLSLKKLSVMVKEQHERERIDKFIHDVEHEQGLSASHVGLTLAETCIFSMKRLERLNERGIELFDLILTCLDVKGYLKNQGVQGRNPYPKHIRDESGENKV
jgi:uncharacterized alpha-E superfamily protein